MESSSCVWLFWYIQYGYWSEEERLKPFMFRMWGVCNGFSCLARVTGWTSPGEWDPTNSSAVLAFTAAPCPVWCPVQPRPWQINSWGLPAAGTPSSVTKRPPLFIRGTCVALPPRVMRPQRVDGWQCRALPGSPWLKEGSKIRRRGEGREEVSEEMFLKLNMIFCQTKTGYLFSPLTTFSFHIHFVLLLRKLTRSKKIDHVLSPVSSYCFHSSQHVVKVNMQRPDAECNVSLNKTACCVTAVTQNTHHNGVWVTGDEKMWDWQLLKKLLFRFCFVFSPLVNTDRDFHRKCRAQVCVDVAQVGGVKLCRKRRRCKGSRWRQEGRYNKLDRTCNYCPTQFT